MRLRTLRTTGGLVAALALASAAQAADTPSVDSIVTKYITALGGQAAIEKVNARLIKFKMEVNNAGTVVANDGEILAKAPNKQCLRVEVVGAGAILEGFDGTVAWAKSPWQDLRLKTGDELAKTKRDCDFHRVLRLKTLYPDLAFKRAEKVGDEEAYLLESKPTATSQEEMWFSAKSGLLLRQDSEFAGPQGKVNTSLLFQDYTASGGVQYPHTLKIKVSAGDQNHEIALKFLEVQHNPSIDDAKFAKPSE